jgi:DNA-directed RNA polymerase subunit B
LRQLAVIEEIDSGEEMTLSIAMDIYDLARRCLKEPFTHMELRGATVFGLAASQTPFAHHNQTPRNVFQAGMLKQTITLYLERHRVNSTGHRLW